VHAKLSPTRAAKGISMNTLQGNGRETYLRESPFFIFLLQSRQDNWEHRTWILEEICNDFWSSFSVDFLHNTLVNCLALAAQTNGHAVFLSLGGSH
jgi:hypothetical protein